MDQQQGQTPEQQIDLLENVEKLHWEKKLGKAKEQSEKTREGYVHKILNYIKLKAYQIRLRTNQQPESEEVQGILDKEIETRLTRLERFKKWAKGNLLALSGVAIMAGSLITAIVTIT